MAMYTVGRQGFNTRQEAEKFARSQGYGNDAIRENTERFDVIDRESKSFIAQNVNEEEARSYQQGNPAATRAPAGAYNEQSIRGVSYSPDRYGSKFRRT